VPFPSRALPESCPSRVVPFPSRALPDGLGKGFGRGFQVIPRFEIVKGETASVVPSLGCRMSRKRGETWGTLCGNGAHKHH